MTPSFRYLSVLIFLACFGFELCAFAAPAPIRTPRFRRIYESLDFRLNGVSAAELTAAAEYLEQFPDRRPFEIVEIIAGGACGMRARSCQGFAAELARLKRVLNPKMPSAEVDAVISRELAEVNARARTRDWSNALRGSLSGDVLFDFAIGYPSGGREKIQLLIESIVGYQALPAAELSAVLADLARRYPVPANSPELLRQLDEESGRVLRTGKFFQWARESFRAHPRMAAEWVTQLLVYPPELHDLLRRSIANQVAAQGSEAEIVREVVADFVRRIPPGLDPAELAARIKRDDAIAAEYLEHLEWTRQQLRLSDEDARKLWDEFLVYPLKQQPAIRSLLQGRGAVTGLDRENLAKLWSQLKQAMPPTLDEASLDAALKKESARAKTFGHYFHWARRTHKFSQPLALVIADFFEKGPPSEYSRFERMIGAEIKERGTDRKIVVGLLGHLSRTVGWQLEGESKGKAVCLETSFLDPDYHLALDASQCLGTLDERFAWIDEAAGKCGHYAPNGGLIASVSAARCEDPIARDLKPCVRTFPKPYRFYHFTTIDKIRRTLPPGVSIEQGVAKHAEIWADHSWDQHGGGNAGLYTATDPISTRSYGSRSSDGRFYLYRVEMPAGTSYLEIEQRGDRSECKLSEESKKILQAAGCPLDVGRLVEREYAPLPPPSCMPILKKAFESLHLRGWSYQYGIAEIPGCTQRKREAFVWTSFEGLPQEAIQRFTSTAPAAGSPERAEALEIERLYKEANGGDPSLWPTLALEAAASASPLERFKAEKLRGCENLLHPERTTSGLELVPCADLVKLGLAEVKGQVLELQKALPSGPGTP